jgi:HTH-type transcriptional regulator, competence development regulator
MDKLGSLLTAARQRRNLTLRAVEAETGISNAYLSQLEHGKIRAPSPVVLSKLSQLYDLSYTLVLEHAGYPVPADQAGRSDAESKFAARIGPVTAEEEEALVEYLEFYRSRRKRGGRR